jgi:IclR family KDG regulon transcriptional repressor
MKQQSDKNNAIEKTLLILQSFIFGNEEMGTVEISNKLGYNKATVSRILTTLSKHGFVRQNPVSKKYRLGETIIQLGSAGSRFLRSNITQISKPYVDELRNLAGETVTLEVFSGESTYMAYVSEGLQRIRIAASVGERLPRHAAAGAKAIIAFLPHEARKKLINSPMEKFTPNTITNPKEFHKHLEDIRKEGVSFDIEEIDKGISAIGAPIFNHEGTPVAAIVIVGPAERVPGLKKNKVISLLKKTAANISNQLHYENEGLKEA